VHLQQVEFIVQNALNMQLMTNMWQYFHKSAFFCAIYNNHVVGHTSWLDVFVYKYCISDKQSSFETALLLIYSYIS